MRSVEAVEKEHQESTEMPDPQAELELVLQEKEKWNEAQRELASEMERIAEAFRILKPSPCYSPRARYLRNTRIFRGSFRRSKRTILLFLNRSRAANIQR
jgi:hypothetical protein